MSDKDGFYAHTEDKGGQKEPLINHLNEVARLSEEFASVWGKAQEAYITGLFHDLGKYGDLFQDVLCGKETHIDHATPGALAVLKKYKHAGFAAAIAIQGHHDGLKSGNHRDLQLSLKMEDTIAGNRMRYSSRDLDLLCKRYTTDGGTFPDTPESDYPDEYRNNQYISAMLYVRMLFSALTDADFLATEAHFNKTSDKYAYRRKGIELDADKALNKLIEYVNGLASSVKADNEIKSLRNDLFSACLKAGRSQNGLYTLTAPTGSGKTLAMLAFALMHAKTNKLRRVIIVLPYLNIIEQTAKVYKKIFENLTKGVFILEDHSLVDWPDDGELRLLAENWDAPIIVTTTVKFFESLFANRSSACRRLHNIAKSVIIFDEAQTMPVGLAIPTLAALSDLCRKFGSTVVFSTATQPAFESLNKYIEEYTSSRWNPVEIVHNDLKLFDRAKRVEVIWHSQPSSWDELTDAISGTRQSLTIVNVRRHAKTLYRALQNKSCENIFHLSTDMCPAHRLDTLNKVKEKLRNGLDCHLVSTQCVEAGVDLDFPIVWRSMAPLESIVQAAGRCNRNGLQKKGYVHVFLPPAEDESYPGKDYKLATAEVKLMLSDGNIDIYDSQKIKEYFRRYFRGIDLDDRNSKLKDAIQAYDFHEVSRIYRWIPNISANVIVPYEPMINIFERLCCDARAGKIDRTWVNQARMLTVGIVLNRNSPITDYLEEIKTQKGERTGWYILLNPNVYTLDMGINLTGTEYEEFYLV